MNSSHWKTNKGKWKAPIGEWEAENINTKRPTPQQRNTIDNTPIAERAILVAVSTPDVAEDTTEEYLGELSFLLATAGGVMVRRVVQNLPHPDPKTYVGSGKLQEIKEYRNALDADLVVCDDELSPIQLRNLEKEIGCRILDRTTLILDIFAKHARTSIAKTQVELAQLQYMLPRLTRLWTHLERQRGGIGMRGPGETQIETDRRLITQKITLLKVRLLTIDKQKTLQRKQRQSMVRVALVGYTNVGKSTLMNRLAKSDVLTENKLFATLDTTVRKVVVDNLPFLLSDTVGFIRKLPHNLVESFKSTLDEVREADILLHVVDVSHPRHRQQMDAVNQTLRDIGADQKPIIVVYNKIDACTPDSEPYCPDDMPPSQTDATPLSAINISATNDINIDTLRRLLYQQVKTIHAVRYPYNNFLYTLADDDGSL